VVPPFLSIRPSNRNGRRLGEDADSGIAEIEERLRRMRSNEMNRSIGSANTANKSPQPPPKVTRNSSLPACEGTIRSGEFKGIEVEPVTPWVVTNSFVAPPDSAVEVGTALQRPQFQFRKMGNSEECLGTAS
jgi:hypothetical protein